MKKKKKKKKAKKGDWSGTFLGGMEGKENDRTQEKRVGNSIMVPLTKHDAVKWVVNC